MPLSFGKLEEFSGSEDAPMPMDNALKSFKNEEDFRDHFLKPLLHRLGFVVQEAHGSREFGRDIVFYKIDEFGSVAYYGMQVKYEESISLSMARELVDDVEQAYHNPYVHPHHGTQHMISRFYIVNAGSISEQAQAHFSNMLVHPAVKYNTIILDGKAIVHLDHIAAFNAKRNQIELLSAVALELKYNEGECKHLMSVLEKYAVTGNSYPLVRLRLAAVSSWLERPSVNDPEVYKAISNYWQEVRMLNTLVDMMWPEQHSELDKRLAVARSLVMKLTHYGKQVTDYIEPLIASPAKQ